MWSSNDVSARAADLSRPHCIYEGEHTQKCLRFTKNEGDMEKTFRFSAEYSFLSAIGLASHFFLLQP